MLMDQTDFLTVGVLGLQGVGKSTLLSVLAANQTNVQLGYVDVAFHFNGLFCVLFCKVVSFNVLEICLKIYARLIYPVTFFFFFFFSKSVFETQNKNCRELCVHQTVGVDMYVTAERMIFLDTQVQPLTMFEYIFLFTFSFS